jgi:phosphoribosylaminoimidazolecarboxamide formyltransferase/IMP cyclohydrolase
MRALLSAYDKTGVVELGRELVGMGWDLVATDGTRALLAEHRLPVLSTTEWTDLPIMFDGRLKTLHHKVFAALLARREQERHRAEQAAIGVVPFDLIAGNFSPFTAAGVSDDEMPDLIDIGGPAMMRAAAKNHRWVLPLVDPADYGWIAAALREVRGDPFGVPQATRRDLAAKAFRVLSELDAAIATAFGAHSTMVG